MFFNSEPIILASGSPRRRQYLDDLGLSFTVCAVAINEIPFIGEDGAAFVERMAGEKAAAASKKFYRNWVIAGDTVVCLGRKILGKPIDKKEAISMLMSLSGREHTVLTGICLSHAEKKLQRHCFVATKVFFWAFDEPIARAYVSSGEWIDKAGAYGIQGKGAFLVKAIEGSYSNVVGLPLHELLEMLRYYRLVKPCN